MNDQVNNDNKTVEEKFNSLPEKIQDIIYSPVTMKKIAGIGEKFQLHLDKIEGLRFATQHVMSGEVRADKFIPHLMKELEVDQETAGKIGKEVDQQIFEEVRDAIKSFSKPATPVVKEKTNIAPVSQETENMLKPKPDAISITTVINQSDEDLKKRKENAGPPVKGKIVLIEDDDILSKVLSGSLREEGYGVEQVFDGEESLKTVQNSAPDLILLDLLLPSMGGFDVLKSLKADLRTRDIPVFILTMLGRDEDVKKGLKLGAADYVVKSQHEVKEIVSIIDKFFVSNIKPVSKTPEAINEPKRTIADIKTKQAVSSPTQTSNYTVDPYREPIE